jgi:FlaA1/EpsC-like NDP-sugar epimerase
VEDSRQAVYASKEVYTDERIWFPFLIQHGYGPKKKTLPQIVAEHCTNVELPQMRKIFPKKGGVVVYRPEERWIRRMEEIQQMAIDSHHVKVFENILNKADTDGQTALVTGATGGIGVAIVDILHKAGAKIIATGTNETKLSALKSNFSQGLNINLFKIYKTELSQNKV